MTEKYIVDEKTGFRLYPEGDLCWSVVAPKASAGTWGTHIGMITQHSELGKWAVTFNMSPYDAEVDRFTLDTRDDAIAECVRRFGS